MFDFLNNIQFNGEFIKIAASLASIVGIIFTIYYKIKENNFNKNLPPFILPNFSDLCIGRKFEIKLIQKNILSRRHLFIHGPPGIGKSTFTLTALWKNKKKLLKYYSGGVVSHDFYKFPNTTDALSNLSKQLANGKDILEPQVMLNKNPCLIFFEGCENAKNINEIISLSPNPVFIFTSRNKYQLIELSTLIKSNIINIELKPLNVKYSLLLLKTLAGHSGIKNNQDFHNISKQLNYNPLSLLLVSDDTLFRKSSQSFLEMIEKVHLKNLNTNTLSTCTFDIDLLIRRAIGLEQTPDSSYNLSPTAKKVLGFCGCISYDFFPTIGVEEYFQGFNEAVEELKSYHIIFDKDSLYIRPYHALIYEYLNKYAIELMNGFDPLFCFVKYFVNTYRQLKQNPDVSHFIRQYSFNFRSHFIKALVKLAEHASRKYDEQLYVYLAYGTYICAHFGYYDEVQQIIDLLETTNLIKFIDCSSLESDIFLLALVHTYDGLEMHDKVINILLTLKNKHKPLPNMENLNSYINAINNLFIYLIKYKRYGDASELVNESIQLIHNTNNDTFKDKNDNEDWIILHSHILQVYFYQSPSNAKVTVEHLNSVYLLLIDKLGLSDAITIRTGIAYALALLPFDIKKAGVILSNMLNSLNNIISFWDIESFDILEEFADFSENHISTKQAYVLYESILKTSIDYFGNGHFITTKYRKKKLYLQECCAKNPFNEDRVFFSIESKSS